VKYTLNERGELNPPVFPEVKDPVSSSAKPLRIHELFHSSGLTVDAQVQGPVLLVAGQGLPNRYGFTRGRNIRPQRWSIAPIRIGEFIPNQSHELSSLNERCKGDAVVVVFRKILKCGKCDPLEDLQVLLIRVMSVPSLDVHSTTSLKED
jgi:hypothetical protein